jgi:hypothetical protein
MITVPLSNFIIIYVVALAIIGIFFAINFFHIILTGTTTLSSFFITLFALISAMLIIYGTWYFLQGIDLSQQITVWNKAWLGGLNGPSF